MRLIFQAFSLLPIKFLALYSGLSLLELGTLSSYMLSSLLQDLASIVTFWPKRLLARAISSLTTMRALDFPISIH